METVQRLKESSEAWSLQFARVRLMRKSKLIKNPALLSRFFMHIPREIRAPGVETQKPAKSPKLVPLPPRNSLLGIPLEIREMIYSYILPDKLSTTELLRRIQNNEHRSTKSPPYTSLSLTCRQIYFEIQPLLASVRVFPLAPFTNHCLAHKHYQTRNRVTDPLPNNLVIHRHFEHYDRDGNVWQPNPEGYTPSIHRTEITFQWYELCGRRPCSLCVNAGKHLRQLHPTQIARAVQRILIPCCMHYKCRGPDGNFVLSTTFGEWIDWAGVGPHPQIGLDPQEMFIVCCACEHEASGVTAAVYVRDYERLRKLGIYLEDAAERFLSLQRIVVYHCRDDANTERQKLDFPAEVVGGMKYVDGARGPRFERMRERFDSPDARWVLAEQERGRRERVLGEREGDIQPQEVYHGRKGTGEKGRDSSLVKLEFYASDVVSGKDCVFGGIPEVTL